MHGKGPILKEYNLEGKVAIITGGGRGIGKAIALTLAEAGADIVVAARTVEQIDQTAEEIISLGRRAIAIQTDVTKFEQVDKMAEKALAEMGKVDILVNNVGFGVLQPIVPMPEHKGRESELLSTFSVPFTERHWHKTIDTNLTSAFLCVRAIGPHMIECRKGKIINISSAEAAKGMAYQVAYSASKAGLSMFTRSLAVEWARYNINVNAIAPGYIHTSRSAVLHENQAIRERSLKEIPLRRACELREVGLLAVYLASDASDYMTGQTIYLDGGFTA